MEHSIIARLKERARRLQKEITVLRIAITEFHLPWYIKVLIVFTVAYALSPVDLIPDFIPVLGLLDDLLILPLLVYIIIRLIPPEILVQCKKIAEAREFENRKNWLAGAVIILLWLAIVIWLALKVIKGLHIQI
jgi:uncharacterized membrane protein YkvA (DUF1232 family)